MDESQTKEELFQELILTMMKKYFLGSNKNISGFDYIVSFLKGNKKAITRDNNLRNRVIEKLDYNDIAKIIGVINFNQEHFIRYVEIYVKKIMLNDVIRSMEAKFGSKAVLHLKEFIVTNDYLYITRNGNARNLVKTLQAEDIKNFFKQLGVNGIEDYISFYYKESNSLRRGR